MAIWPALAIVAAAALAAHQQRAAARRRRSWRRLHPAGHDGVIPGAEPIRHEGGGRAALLLHGFGDTPRSLAGLAQALVGRGWSVHAPLLPGHGCTLEAFERSSAEEWVTCARTSYRQLAGEHGRVAVVGISMGGALAAMLGGDEQLPPPAAAVLLAPYLIAPARAGIWTALWPAWQLWQPWVPGNAALSIRDPGARRASLAYGGATPRLLRELRAVVQFGGEGARTLRAPTLAIFSTGDYRIPLATARRAVGLFPQGTSEVHWVERSGHVITVDRDAAEVVERTVAWLERHLPDRVGARHGVR